MRKSVGIVITDKLGKYLMQMRDGTPGICNPLKWNFFGGGQQENEDVLLAAQREIFEEIGLKADADDLDVLGDIVFSDDEKFTLTKYNKPLSWMEFKVNEGAGAAFFTVEEMTKIDLTEKTRILVEKFL